MDETESAGRVPSKEKLNDDVDENDPEPTKFTDMIKIWPKSTFLIIVNEFCERFSYYGMRSVLTLYFINILNFSDNLSTILYHSFNVLCYASPMLGSIIADGYIGKFWTIFSISIVYACGQITLAVASTFGKGTSVHPWLDLLGLFVIGMGTGGIKPCVSSFGGDQFKPHYLLMISIYFSVFYFTINAGSTISSFISPMMRAQPCLGHDSCYPLSFGIPAVLMIVATVIFVLGSPFYKKVPPKENTIARVFFTLKKAFTNKLKKNAPPREHWVEHYLDDHECLDDVKCQEAKDKCAQKKFVQDVRSLVRIFVMMLPMPFFWTLYDQQGSRWVIQAVAMDSHVSGSFNLLPDQMSTLNALLILIFIPIFQGVIYPLFEKMGIRTTPLRRMVVGGFLAALSFVICGFVQVAVNKTLPDVPASHTAFVSVVNGYPEGTCNFAVSLQDYDTKYVNANSSLIDNKVEDLQQLWSINVASSSQRTFHFEPLVNSTNCQATAFNMDVILKGGKSYMLTIFPTGRLLREAKWEKPKEGQGQFALGINLVFECAQLPPLNGTSCGNGAFNGSFALCRYDKDCDPQKHDWYYAWKSSDGDKFKSISVEGGGAEMGYALDYKDIKPGTYRLYLVNYLIDYSGDRTPKKSEIQTAPFDIYMQVKKMGGVYAWTVSPDSTGGFSSTLHPIVPDNHMSILWQVPQYFVITAAEVLFSITGLEFAYSQSAPSLKAVVSAMWLFTQAIGDSVIILIDEVAPFNNLATEMFTYAGLLVVVFVVFMLMSIFYYEYTIPERLPENQSDEGSYAARNGKRRSTDGVSVSNAVLAFPNDAFTEDEHL